MRAASVSPWAGMPAAPSDVRGGPGAGGVDDRAGQDVLAGGEADQERRRVAAGGADPVEAEPGHRDHAGAVADVRLERGQVGEGLQVVGGELAPVGSASGVGLDPAGVGEQPAGGGVDVVPPRREQPHVPPLAHRGGRTVAGLQDGERDAALGEVRGGGQPDRAGADDDDGQVVQATLIVVLPRTFVGPHAPAGPLSRRSSKQRLHAVSRSVNLEACRSKARVCRSSICRAAEACCPPIAQRRSRPDVAAVLAPPFKALGDPVRLRLMSMIASAPTARSASAT